MLFPYVLFFDSIFLLSISLLHFQWKSKKLWKILRWAVLIFLKGIKNGSYTHTHTLLSWRMIQYPRGLWKLSTDQGSSSFTETPVVLGLAAAVGSALCVLGGNCTHTVCAFTDLELEMATGSKATRISRHNFQTGRVPVHPGRTCLRAQPWESGREKTWRVAGQRKKRSSWSN